MGFDIVHMNLHKTFATPHGGGGPGAGPVAVSERLVPFLPGPRPVRVEAAATGPATAGPTPERSIGRMHSWHGNALVLARALAYILVNGGDGLRRVAEIAVLNANWIRHRLSGTYDVPFDRPCMHEVVLSARNLKQAHGVRALDVAKRLLEEGFHAPTVYFPLIVEEALMIEPTETESPQTLQALAEALERIAAEAATAHRFVGRGPRAHPGPPGGRGPGRPDADPHLRRPGRSEGRPVEGIFTTRFVDPYLKAHKDVYERTDGRIGKHSNGVPALLLTTTGRKSGLPRTNGLTYCTDRGDVVVVASNGGSDRPPAWLLNLQADPRVTVRLGRRVAGATARVADPEERAQLWPLVNRTNRGMSRLFHPGVTGRYDVYQRHATTGDPGGGHHPGPPDRGRRRLIVPPAGSVEEIGLFADDPVEQRLEAEPTGQMGPHLEAWSGPSPGRSAPGRRPPRPGAGPGTTAPW